MRSLLVIGQCEPSAMTTSPCFRCFSPFESLCRLVGCILVFHAHSFFRLARSCLDPSSCSRALSEPCVAARGFSSSSPQSVSKPLSVDLLGAVRVDELFPSVEAWQPRDCLVRLVVGPTLVAGATLTRWRSRVRVPSCPLRRFRRALCSGSSGTRPLAPFDWPACDVAGSSIRPCCLALRYRESWCNLRSSPTQRSIS